MEVDNNHGIWHNSRFSLYSYAFCEELNFVHIVGIRWKMHVSPEMCILSSLFFCQLLNVRVKQSLLVKASYMRAI